MSLYTNEQVCRGCIHAVFHECCRSFCKCLIGEDIDELVGTCKSREESK